MLMFSRLNAGGRTVVLITHEQEIAAYAKRTVRLRDGLIVEDRRRLPVDAPPPGLTGEPAGSMHAESAG
jgi:putative ABC transport system ATP-binding protein